MNLSFQVHEIMQMFTSYCFLSIPLDCFTHWFLFCRIQQLRGHYLSFHEFWNSNGRKKIPVLCKPAKHFGVMEEQRSQPNPQLVLVHSRNGTVWSYWRQEINELWSERPGTLDHLPPVSARGPRVRHEADDPRRFTGQGEGGQLDRVQGQDTSGGEGSGVWRVTADSLNN